MQWLSQKVVYNFSKSVQPLLFIKEAALLGA